MTRKILAATAVAMVVATAAFGQEQPAPAPADPLTTNQPAAAPAQPPRAVQAEAYLASNFLGESVLPEPPTTFRPLATSTTLSSTPKVR